MEESSLGKCWIGLGKSTTNSKFKGTVLLKSIAPVGGEMLYAKILLRVLVNLNSFEDVHVPCTKY